MRIARPIPSNPCKQRRTYSFFIIRMKMNGGMPVKEWPMLVMKRQIHLTPTGRRTEEHLLIPMDTEWLSRTAHGRNFH